MRHKTGAEGESAGRGVMLRMVRDNLSDEDEV